MSTAVIMTTLLAVGLAGQEGTSSSPSVNIWNRTVVGRWTQHSAEFLGIPFGTYDVEYTSATLIPEPRASSNSSSTFFAQSFGDCCRQPDVGLYIPSQSKDCLNLNVFTPKNAVERKGNQDTEKKPLPVLFWVYGGGGTTGCSAQSLPALYNGTNLLANNHYDEDVIVVTINYRVNAYATLFLDALCQEDLHYNTSGHWGIQDVILALQWVQQTIHVFGGDKNRVTVFGESAGGNIAAQLDTYVGTDHLYQSYISESGDADVVTGFANRSMGQQQGAAFMTLLGCDSSSNLTCLRAQPAEKILKAAGLSQFATVVDGTFLPKYPQHLWEEPGENHAFRHRPAMMGLNSPDNWPYCAEMPSATASFVVPYLTQQIPLWSGIPASGVPAALEAYGIPTCVAPQCCAIASLLFRDMMMWCPARRALKAKLLPPGGNASSPSPNGYLFSLRCDPRCPHDNGGHGVCEHTSELAFVFGTVSDYESDNAHPNCTWSRSARRYSNALITQWVSFAATGHPNTTAWKPFTASGSNDSFTIDVRQEPFEVKPWGDTNPAACEEVWDPWDAKLAAERFGN